MNRKSVVGILLVILGVMAGLVNLGVLSGMLFLPTISLGLLSMYVAFGGRKRNSNLGFLIPGCIVGAIGLYAILEDMKVFGADAGGTFLMFLGAAFLTIMVVHTMHGEDRDWGSRFWPIFPAAGLIGTGAVANSQINMPVNIWNMIGPLVLVVVGLSMWAKNRNPKSEEITVDTESDKEE